MKKIPTLFKREFQDHRVISIIPELSSPDLAWVLAGEGVATEKIDGAIATIMALDRAIRCGNDNGASVYDGRGILFI